MNLDDLWEKMKESAVKSNMKVNISEDLSKEVIVDSAKKIFFIKCRVRDLTGGIHA